MWSIRRWIKNESLSLGCISLTSPMFNIGYSHTASLPAFVSLPFWSSNLLCCVSWTQTVTKALCLFVFWLHHYVRKQRYYHFKAFFSIFVALDCIKWHLQVFKNTPQRSVVREMTVQATLTWMARTSRFNWCTALINRSLPLSAADDKRP